jgi:hypothetical protein
MATASGIDVRKMSPTAVQALVDMIDAFARFAHAATVDTADPGGLLPLADAARVAGTSMRVLRDAIRRGELPAYGRQRDRGVTRADLTRWIESRRVRPVSGPIDADMERRVTRLSRDQAEQSKSRPPNKAA